MVKIRDTTIIYNYNSYTCKVDYMQKDKKFRLTLPEELSALFNTKFLYGDTEEEAEQKGTKMLTSFFESKKTPVEKVISYNFGASLHITNPSNGYVLTTINTGSVGVSPAVSFTYSVGYRQMIPDPRDLSKMEEIYFKYDKDNVDRRESWGPEKTVIPWTQAIEDFFASFTTYLENAILNMFIFLDQPYKKLRDSIETIGPNKALPLLTDEKEIFFFPSHEHSRCPKCNEMMMLYTNLRGETEIRCRTCGTVEVGHLDEYIAERLKGANLISKRIQET
jgi:hypothetical protein